MPGHAHISPADLRAFAGQFPTGVAVVTTRDGSGRLFGITISAVASLSLAPPLFLVCLDHRSNTLGAILESRHFCINFLSSRQTGISKVFASKAEDKFREIDYTPGVLGSPMIAGAVAHGECTVQDIHAAGDHAIVIGSLARVAVHDEAPLAYCRGRYAALAEFHATA